MEEGEIPSEEPTARKPWILVIGAVISAVVLLVVLFAPLVAATETYTEEESYTRDAEYVILRDEADTEFGLMQGCYCEVFIKIRNREPTGEEFRVRVQVFREGKLDDTAIDDKYIGGGSSYEFDFYFDTDCFVDYSWRYDIYPPDITDSRLVEKERTIYKSAFQVLTGG